jgi:hypothetical protein
MPNVYFGVFMQSRIFAVFVGLSFMVSATVKADDIDPKFKDGLMNARNLALWQSKGDSADRRKLLEHHRTNLSNYPQNNRNRKLWYPVLTEHQHKAGKGPTIFLIGTGIVSVGGIILPSILKAKKESNELENSGKVISQRFANKDTKKESAPVAIEILPDTTMERLQPVANQYEHAPIVKSGQ